MITRQEVPVDLFLASRRGCREAGDSSLCFKRILNDIELDKIYG